MDDLINSSEKKKLCSNMAKNLPVLRAKVGLSQTSLSKKLGFSRQTINAIESGKREMQWSTFTALALFFMKEASVKELMIVTGTMNNDLENWLKCDSGEMGVYTG